MALVDKEPFSLSAWVFVVQLDRPLDRVGQLLRLGPLGNDCRLRIGVDSEPYPDTQPMVSSSDLGGNLERERDPSPQPPLTMV
jgi:hypothetical protein